MARPVQALLDLEARTYCKPLHLRPWALTLFNCGTVLPVIALFLARASFGLHSVEIRKAIQARQSNDGNSTGSSNGPLS